MELREIWKDIPGYEGLYQVSNTGLIKSIERYISKRMFGGGNSQYLRKARIMMPDDVQGYKQVQLSKDGNKQRFKIHRIVAITFIDNPENKPCVNHIDSDRSNNNVLNLEWCTVRENYEHANNLGRMINLQTLPTEKRRKGELINTSKLTREQVIEIRNTNASQASIARKYSVSKTAIRLIQTRKNWKHV